MEKPLSYSIFLTLESETIAFKVVVREVLLGEPLKKGEGGVNHFEYNKGKNLSKKRLLK